MPQDPPRKACTSIVVYVPQTRSELQTIAGKGWFSILRLYRTPEKWYRFKCLSGEIELVE